LPPAKNPNRSRKTTSRRRLSLKRSLIVTAIGCLLGLAGSAHAAQLASATIYGAFSQQTAQCSIGNVGTTPIFVTVNIVDEAGDVVPTTEHCGTVEPGSLCQVFASPIATASAFACTATTKGDTGKLRGSFGLLDANLSTLRTEELR
jgi:hypothetical protein